MLYMNRRLFLQSVLGAAAALHPAAKVSYFFLPSRRHWLLEGRLGIWEGVTFYETGDPSATRRWSTQINRELLKKTLVTRWTADRLGRPEFVRTAWSDEGRLLISSRISPG